MVICVHIELSTSIIFHCYLSLTIAKGDSATLPVMHESTKEPHG